MNISGRGHTCHGSVVLHILEMLSHRPECIPEITDYCLICLKSTCCRCSSQAVVVVPGVVGVLFTDLRLITRRAC